MWVSFHSFGIFSQPQTNERYYLHDNVNMAAEIQIQKKKFAKRYTLEWPLKETSFAH